MKKDKKPIADSSAPLAAIPMLSVRADDEKDSSFTEGIRMLNTKGALVTPVKLTKERAQIILSMVHRYRHEYNWTHEEDKESDNEMQCAMQWIVNQINKRWSQNELYSPDKRKGRHDR